MQTTKRQNLILILTVLTLVLNACKKDKPPTPSPTSNIYDVRDSAFILSKEMYLWSDKLPTHASFKPQGYLSAEEVMMKVRTYSPLKPNGQHVDQWSFAMPQHELNNAVQGSNEDIGCGLRFSALDDLRIAWVQPNSSAGTNGLVRGLRVRAVNNIPALVANAGSLTNVLLHSTNVTLTIENPDLTLSDKQLIKSTYAASFVNRKVIKRDEKKIGYLSLTSFLGNALEDLGEAMQFFMAENIQELVIDLRYNGGGQVSIMEFLANQLVPSMAQGQVMVSYLHNSKYAIYDNKTLFTTGIVNMNLKRVFFITSISTASASEILIHSLKPYLSVIVVGVKTQGKFYGMYTVPILDYYCAPIAFQVENANGELGDVDGIVPTIVSEDDLTHDLSSSEEKCFKNALIYMEDPALLMQLRQEHNDNTAIGLANKGLSLQQIPGCLKNLPSTSLP